MSRVHYTLVADSFKSLTAHVLNMLNRQVVEVQKPIHAVRQASLLIPVKLRVLDRTGDALLPAHVGQAVSLCFPAIVSKSSTMYLWLSSKAREEDERAWMEVFCCSVARNLRRSFLSASESLSSSCASIEDILYVVGAWFGR